MLQCNILFKSDLVEYIIQYDIMTIRLGNFRASDLSLLRATCQVSLVSVAIDAKIVAATKP